MKVQDFAYQVSLRTMELLENAQHYKITEANRKEILATILKELDTLIQKSSAPVKKKK
ncbi:MAG TPA: hypothetical protein PLY90_12710 [Candidatus Hydrogenedentes bacterium]|jgi:hypothetical protein|nr:MAG: hypothetical protein BWY07_02465 [Candidatus Hydrogenedentes bacterium ADurb.Bin170]HNZ49190.1 hypothetical protein [Candidatus Hydrogenedentota bacterium]HPX87370.1 hypothetical protein [Candidatus Hydrogenedentota bacterium]HQB04139.1 hypothetical protein [Candidatus Hydrogenedentota bacterium]